MNNKLLNEYLNRFDKEIADKVIDKVAIFLKDYIEKSGTKGFVIGMSGGIDCCVSAALCKKADIPCYLVSMSCGNSMVGTQANDAMLFAETFDLPLGFIDITEQVEATKKGAELYSSFIKLNNDGNNDMAFANIAPRERMKQLYCIGQMHKLLVLGTSNYSEVMTGYFTKWGDGVADIEPIYFFTKSEIKILAKHLGIPEQIINKAPSADLWKGQTDEDELGLTYEEIDNYLLFGIRPSKDKKRERLEYLMNSNTHKLNPIPKFFFERK